METGGGANAAGPTRAIVYCLIPAELATKLHEPLRRHFLGDGSVEVVVEKRGGERRGGGGRRGASAAAATVERRRVRNPAGRRVGERRAPQLVADPSALPRRLARYRDRLCFFERVEPSSQAAEDLDTARFVIRIQGGEEDLFAQLYTRYFARVYTYVRAALRSANEAEDLTQDVFVAALRALGRYERRRQPFRAWLFTIARNITVNHLERTNRATPLDPNDIRRRSELDERWAEREPVELHALDWITDSDLQLFIERLPPSQRQVLVLRYVAGLTTNEVAAVLGISEVAARQQHARALRFLKARLSAVGRRSERPGRIGTRLIRRPSTVLRTRRFSLLAPGASR